MTDHENNGPPSTRSWLLVALFWAYVGIPLAWGVYETLGGVVDLFTGQ